MAIYLLDTSTFSFLMSRHSRVLSRLNTVAPPDRVVICPIVRGEVLYGLERMPQGSRRRHLEETAANLFAQIPCVEMSAVVGDFYARIKRDAEQRGTPLDENDLWIAATALAIRAVLVTSDRDFQRVSGLSVEDWTA